MHFLPRLSVQRHRWTKRRSRFVLLPQSAPGFRGTRPWVDRGTDTRSLWTWHHEPSLVYHFSHANCDGGCDLVFASRPETSRGLVRATAWVSTNSRQNTGFIVFHKPLHRKKHAAREFSKIGKNWCEESRLALTVTLQLLPSSHINQRTISEVFLCGAIHDRFRG